MMPNIDLDNLTLDKVRKIICSLLNSKYAKDIVSRNLYGLIFTDNKDNNSRINVSTLAIDHNGYIYLNLDFLKQYAKTEDDLACLFMHEILHQLFGDCLEILYPDKNDPDYSLKMISQNIAMDMRINAYITKVCENKNRSYEIFSNIYTPLIVSTKGQDYKAYLIYKLLTTYSKFDNKDREAKFIGDVITEYDSLYIKSKTPEITSYYDSYLNIYYYLKENAAAKYTILLIGDHNQDKPSEGDNKNQANIGDGDSLENIKGAIISDMKTAGFSSTASTSIIDIADGNLKLDFNIFKRLSFKSCMSNIKLEGEKTSRYYVSSPSIPKTISRKDLFMLNAGFIPTLWKKKLIVEEKIPKMLPIYLDVSGSMFSALPEITRLILNVQEDLEYVWGFSNQVHKHTLQDLEKGKIRSTGGTDFDCIIKHAEKEGYSSILVITDGYASCRTKEKLDWLKQVIVVLCTDSRDKNNWFSRIYDNTMQIEDMTI